MTLIWDLSIHLLSLIWGWVTMAASLAGYSRRPSSQQCFPAPPGGGSWGIPRPDETYNPYSDFRVCSRISSQLVMPRKPPKGGTQEASKWDARTSSTASFRAAALLWACLDVGASRFIFKAEPCQPTEEAHFGHLCPWPCSLVHYLQSWP